MTNFIAARHIQQNSPRIALAVLTIGLTLAISGCGTGTFSSTNPIQPGPTSQPFSGRVMGGQQPVSGSTIQLYAVNATTFRGVSSSVLTASVTTDANGNFSLAGKISCPAGALVYLVAIGGNAGGGSNANLSEMAGLGPCSAISSSTFIFVDEVTTVASVYALGPFMADYAHVGATSANLAAITNAFTMINSLVNVATGISPGPAAPANSTIPSTQLNTLADIMAACINSIPASGSTCSSLFALALPSSGSPQPTETIGAILNIARNPGANVPQIFALLPTTPPFQPNLSTSPNDWTVAVKLTGNNLSTPYGVAIDSSGNAWVTNETGARVSEFGPIGTSLAGSGSNYTFSGAQGLTIDPSGNVWVANTGGNTIVKLTSVGALSTSVTNFSIDAPIDIAADARGNIWIANFLPNTTTGYTVTELNNSASLLNGLAVSSPTAVAIDPNGNVWISSAINGTLVEYSKTATAISTGNGFTDNALQGPLGVATDASGNAWVVGQGGPELSGFTSAGTAVAASPVYAPLTQPAGVAVDSAGTIWVTNSTASGFLSEFTAGTGVAVASEQSIGSLNAPVQIAVDPSGNLWTANSGDNSVTIFVGLAATTTTPLVARTQ